MRKAEVMTLLFIGRRFRRLAGEPLNDEVVLMSVIFLKRGKSSL